MEIAQIKQSLHTLIDQIEDIELLAAVYRIMATGQEADWWDTVSDVEKKHILAGLDDIKNGGLYSHAAVMKEVKELLR